MFRTPLFAFVDEFGDPNLNIELSGTPDHFVLVAVTVSGDELPSLSRHVESVRARHFQTGEIKSKGVGSNWTRRDRILDDLLEASFRFHVLVVHKGRLRKDTGLAYKRSFLKYVHGLLYQRLFLAVSDLHVIADEHGSPSFMEGFRRYVRERHIPSLFEHADIRFENSRAQPLIQLADMLAGTVGHALIEGGERSLVEVLDRLEDRIITFVEFPSVVRPPELLAAGAASEFDGLVRAHSLNRAAAFLDTHRDAEEHEVRCQVEVLRYLQFYAQFVSETEYVPTRRLRRLLEDTFGERPREHFFRSRIIARLRDEGVLVASSPKGYKIPLTLEDMHRFVEQADQIIHPLLARINRARDELRAASDGSLDILADPALKHLRVSARR